MVYFYAAHNYYAQIKSDFFFFFFFWEALYKHDNKIFQEIFINKTQL